MYIKFFILFMFSVSTGIAKAQTMAAPVTNDSTVIAFASDTQAPMWVETILLKSNKNRTATRMVFDEILNKRPSSLFLLGDVVNLGYSDRQWKPIDKYIKKLRDENIEVHAILGNHEVMGRAKLGQKKFQARFPNHLHTGYVEIKDSIAIVLLNSNFNTLTKAEDAEQVSWYKITLEQLDADPSIHYIITGTHHSPYTNSKIVKPSKTVQEKFVPAFMSSKKSKLFLSGHCHGFEHYKMGGKDFMVIGGGGGLHQPLRSGDNALPDLATDYKPMYHYLTVQRSADGLKINSIQLTKDFTAFEEGFRLDIKTTENILATNNLVQEETTIISKK